MPVDDAVLDYDPIGEFEQEDRKMLRMLLVAAQRSMVDLVVQAVTGARARAARDSTWSRSRSCARSARPTDGLDLEEGEVEEAIVDVGAHVTNIVVHARGRDPVRPHPAERRPRHHGRDRAIGRGRGRRRRAPEARRGGRGRARARRQVRQAALQRAAAFVDEVRSSLEFYTAQAKDARIGRVLVTGGGSRLDGLVRADAPADPRAGRARRRVRPRRRISSTRPTSRPRSRSWPSRSAWPCRRMDA